jgi:hypothetical protein
LYSTTWRYSRRSPSPAQRPGPLTGFWFSVSAGDEESWDVQIDDLVVS